MGSLGRRIKSDENMDGFMIRMRKQSCWLILLFVVLGPKAFAEEDFAAPPAYVNAREMRADASLRSISFANENSGVAVGALGTIVVTQDGGKSWQDAESTTLAHLDDVLCIDDLRVVAVGGSYDPYTRLSRGAALFSKDGGKSWWRAADQELPRLHDLYQKKDGTLIVVGDWSPVALTRVFESTDGGQTWNPSPEGQDQAIYPKTDLSARNQLDWAASTRLPIIVRGYCSTPEAPTVWAVGDHGTIISRVHNEPWQLRRGNGAHAGILVISGSVGQIAWPLIARESLEARLRTSLLVTTHPQSRSSDIQHSPVDLVRQAAANLGVTSVDAIESDSKLTSHWIAFHRPAILLIDLQLPKTTLDALTQKAVELGVHRVIGYDLNARGQASFHPSAVLPSVGVLASDVWQDAFGVLSPQRTVPGPISLRLLYDDTGGDLRGNSLGDGVRLANQHMLSSKPSKASRRQIQMTHARRNHQSLVAQLLQQSENAKEFRTSVQSLLNQTAKSDQLRLAWMICRQLALGSECVDPAAFQIEVLEELADRHSGTSLASLAKLRIESIQHSHEWQHLRRALPAWKQEPATGVDTVAVSPFQVEPGGVAQASYSAPVLVPDFKPAHVVPGQNKARDSIDLRWEFHPLPLMAQEAARLRGDQEELKPAEGISANLRRMIESSSGDWARIADRKSRKAIVAKPAREPPRLDGRFDDPCWRGALPTAGSDRAFRCAYDEQFVYFAIMSRPSNHDSEPNAASANGSAPARDHDLTESDRLELMIDTDADLLTAFNLQMSVDGRTNDSVDGYAHWQPTWYVASQNTVHAVQTEIAIMRRDLSDLPIVAGQSWLIRNRRLVAGQKSIPSWMPNPAEWRRIRFE